MKLKPVFVALFCALVFTASAQFPMPERASDLSALLDILRSAPNDSLREKANTTFHDLLAKTLAEPSAFAYPFKELTSVGVIDSPDGQVRIVGWNVEQDDRSQRYYAFVLKRDDRKGIHKLFELTDNPDPYLGRTDEILESENWYGALYYQIIPTERNNKTVYIVLGWDGASDRTNMKIIDALTFSGNNVKLGAPMFKLRDIVQKRVYFEHSEKAVMSLRWDETQARIMFDHLSPESSSLEGFYEYYVPDMSYDALEQQGNRWVLVEDVIGLNKQPETVRVSTYDEKTGEVKTKDVENSWVDPSKGGAPENIHVAAMPDKTAPVDEKAGKKDDKRTAQEIWDEKKRHRKDKRQIGTATGVSKRHKR